MEDELELIYCEMCMEDKEVDIHTWAYAHGMCEKCYCIYQGG